jgi:hypothetical protein
VKPLSSNLSTAKKKKKREVVGMPVASERIGVSKTDHGGVEGSWNNQRGSDLGDV